jgi:hypothetical protein
MTSAVIHQGSGEDVDRFQLFYIMGDAYQPHPVFTVFFTRSI